MLTKSGKTLSGGHRDPRHRRASDTTLAKMAGLEIGERGGIRVDEQMRTSDPDIFAVGDAVEVKDFVTGEWGLIALAGPANRQGRIAADVIAGRDSRFRGTQGTSIIGLFGGAAAWTGVNEKTLNRLGDTISKRSISSRIPMPAITRVPRPIAMKVIFRKSDGTSARCAGARRGWSRQADQCPGHGDPDGRHHLRSGRSRTVLRPQFGSAKDPVNFAGMVAADVLRGDMPLSHWDSADGGFLLDVRDPVELAVERCRARSTSRWDNSARASGNSRATARSMSLPLRPARLLRDAHPVAERFQS